MDIYGKMAYLKGMLDGMDFFFVIFFHFLLGI